MTTHEFPARTLLALRIGDKFLDWLRKEYQIPFSIQERSEQVSSHDQMGRPVIHVTYTIAKRIVVVTACFTSDDGPQRVREVTARMDGLNVQFSCLVTITEDGIDLKAIAVPDDESRPDKCSCGRKASGLNADGNAVCWHWPHFQTIGAAMATQ